MNYAGMGGYGVDINQKSKVKSQNEKEERLKELNIFAFCITF